MFFQSEKDFRVGLDHSQTHRYTMIEMVLFLFGLYWLISAVLLRKPSLLHFSKQPVRRNKLLNTPVSCVHISHRGGAGESLENTMKAFDHAASIGTDMFEIDCQITKDAFTVVAHDNNLLRLCGKNIMISDTKFVDLPPLLTSQRLDFDHGSTITKVIPECDRKIVLLEDLFLKHPDMPMNIDIKRSDDHLIHLVSELVTKYQREHLTVWGNSSHAHSKNIRSANRDIATLFTVREFFVTIILYYFGLLPFVPVFADFFEVPMCSIFLEHLDTFPTLTKSRILRCALRIMDYLICNDKLIRHLRKRGVPTYFFVLNAEHEWQRAVNCGAAGIMTDYPKRLQNWLKYQ